MPTRSLLARCALGAAVLTGCGAPSRPASPLPAGANACLVTDSTATRRDTLQVALDAAVDPANAPVPATDAERLVFLQLYETLVRVDCAGTVQPGVAAAWHASDGGRRWVFELSAGARFWDGTPVDAATLRAAWTGTPGLVVADVQPAGERAVTVSLALPRPVEAFGDAAWSVVKRIPESPWPVGTGPVWIGAADGNVLRAAPTPVAPTGTPVVEFRSAPGTDARDLVDRPNDVVLTRDAGAVRYAAGRGDWRDVPLAWDRLYVLVSRVRVGTGTTAQLDPEAATAMARDAVRDDARLPAGTTWWADPRCPPDVLGLAPPRQAPLVRLRGVVVPDGDRVAADVAARLVARSEADLARLLGTAAAGMSAEPLPATAFREQLAAGDAPAFLVPLPSRPLDACRAIAGLRAAAPWLHALGRWRAEVLAPLVETRAHLLLRGVPTAALDRDGGVRLLPGRSP